MKILLITGSPHKQGTTAVLAAEFIRGAHEAGHDVIRFDAALKDVHPCIACEKCHSAVSACVFRDDFDELRDELIAADAVVFLTPIYYYGMTAQIKTVIDRFYAIEAEIHNNKKTALMMAFADTTMESAQGAMASYYGMVDYLGWEIVDVIAAGKSRTPEDVLNSDFPKQAYELGKKILVVVKDEPEFSAATSLNDLVARLANFSQIAEEAIKETEEKDVFLDGMDFFE